MGKAGGLNQRLYVAGYDISGDIIEVNNCAQPVSPLDTTGIDKSAMERIPGQRDGIIDVTAWFNPENVTSVQEHAVYSTLPRTDVQVMYVLETPAIGAAVAMQVSQQINYDPKRAQNGEFTFGVSSQANAWGQEHGKLLTVGKRTDTAATNGSSLDQVTASTAFGWQAYLQVFAFAGTDVTVKIQDSADNSAWADLAGAAFTAITTTTPQTQRLGTVNGSTAAVRRYVRVATTTAAGFTNLVFAVGFVRNAVANAF